MDYKAILTSGDAKAKKKLLYTDDDKLKSDVIKFVFDGDLYKNRRLVNNLIERKFPFKDKHRRLILEEFEKNDKYLYFTSMHHLVEIADNPGHLSRIFRVVSETGDIKDTCMMKLFLNNPNISDSLIKEIALLAIEELDAAHSIMDSDSYVYC